MKRIVSILFNLLISMSIHAQSQYDYMDDDTVVGGADRVLNVFIVFFFIVIAFVAIIFVIGGLAKIKYEFSPQKEIDRQKKEKEEREKQERIRKEQEHQKALLALPEKKVRLFVEGRPHLVELAGCCHRIHTEMIAICLRSVNRIIWDDDEITDQICFIDKYIDLLYGKYYKSQYNCFESMSELVVSKYCADLADKTSSVTFEIEFTIRGSFNPQKLQIIHHIHEGLRHHHVSRDIKCLEFVLYDGDVIQTHLVNGKPLCFPYKGYNSFPEF